MLELTNVTRRYGAKPAVSDVSLILSPGKT